MPRLRDLTTLIVSVAIAAGVSTSLRAQMDPNERCWAPEPSYSERTEWYDARCRFINDTNTRSTASLVRRFAGRYRLLIVTTEGGLEREVAEYNLKLAPPSPRTGQKIQQIGGGGGRQAAGAPCCNPELQTWHSGTAGRQGR